MAGVSKVITVIIMTIVLLNVAIQLWTPLGHAVNNATALDDNAAIVSLVTTLFWILIAAGVVMTFVFALLPSKRRYRR